MAGRPLLQLGDFLQRQRNPPSARWAAAEGRAGPPLLPVNFENGLMERHEIHLSDTCSLSSARGGAEEGQPANSRRTATRARAKLPTTSFREFAARVTGVLAEFISAASHGISRFEASQRLNSRQSPLFSPPYPALLS